jgi:cellulose synthase/poly-beta-1,6-N-acetylglucosamine synthase-like glycosyltransferase
LLDTLGWASLALALLLSIYAARSLVFVRAARVEKSPAKAAGHHPFVSVLVATRNEALVIRRLLGSLARLAYPQGRFEIIIVDDSDDGTYDIMSAAKVPNLKAIRRNGGKGWKGGALNLALNVMDEKSSYCLVLDADSVLAADTIERFVARIESSSAVAVQGFPVSVADLGGRQEPNWVARGIDFRLAQRNMAEFPAKDGLGLPVQITGSLFMIRSDVLKAARFSDDLCEDWDLTLDVYAQPLAARPRIVFDPSLVSYCEATTKLGAYFRQRMRVSEGHTRGFRKRLKHVLASRMPAIDKLEITLTGLQYAKFIPVLALAAMDAAALAAGGWASGIVQASLALQAGIFAASVVANCMAAGTCGRIRSYGAADVSSLLVLNMVTMPAFVWGSLRGFACSKGTFYRTQRNAARAAVVAE